jgi:hypothetical protein
MRSLETKVLLYSTAAFTPHWSPLSDLTGQNSKRTPLSTLVPLVVETPEFDGQKFENAAVVLTVHESPLRAGTSKILVYLSNGRMRRIPRHGYGMHVPAALFSYSCDGNGHGVGERDHRWRRTSVRAAVPRMPLHELSYAGYAVEDLEYEVYNATAIPRERGPRTRMASDKALVGAPKGAHWQHLSSYSGVVTTLMPEEVVVAYYE